MDRTTRWETEAIRGSAGGRQSPPKPTRKRTRSDFTDNRHWVTLREAESATGIPTNTLRKWVRKADLPSYLEADGDLALRMVDLDAVVARAKQLGRNLVPPSGGTGETQSSQGGLRAREPGVGGGIDQEAEVPTPEPQAPPGTMIVPIDAWNKMLIQLGNLHEAGQQLAEASERAAKAETETKFLREQLAEKRSQNPDTRSQNPDEGTQDPEPEPEPPVEMTTYWRHLTTGWRSRKKRQTRPPFRGDKRTE